MSYSHNIQAADIHFYLVVILLMDKFLQKGNGIQYKAST
jgi:hypothetical protein